MKLFRIGKISKLYGISVDTLRHYEKMDILKPEQISDSGYRYYSNRQICKLNIIRTLREMDVSLPEIRDFMIDRTLEKSEQLIDFQLKTLHEKQKQLEQLKKELEHRQHYLMKARQITETGIVELKTLPGRRSRNLERETSVAWDIDRIHKEIETKIVGQKLSYFAWGRAGAIISKADFNDSNYLKYSSSFIFDKEGDHIIPKGDYLCVHFRGQYSSAIVNKYYSLIKRSMSGQGLVINGDAVEIYKLDIHETENEQEFLTEIQVPVKATSQSIEVVSEHQRNC